MTSKIVYLGGVTAIKIGHCNGILDHLGYREIDEVADERGIHGVNQPHSDYRVIDAPSLKGRTS